jgi:hypothetical protein
MAGSKREVRVKMKWLPREKRNQTKGQEWRISEAGEAQNGVSKGIRREENERRMCARAR